MFADTFRDFKMNRNKYNVEQAVQFILKPGDESELSDLDEDDDHNEISACNNHGVEIEDDIEGDDRREEQVNDNHERNISKEKVQDSTLNQPAKDTKFNDHNYRWRNVSPPVFDTSFGGEEFDVPPENFEELTPLNYFPMLWNKGLNKLSLLKFVYQIASALIRAGTVVSQVGRPPKRRSLELDVVRCTPSEPEPIADI